MNSIFRTYCTTPIAIALVSGSLSSSGTIAAPSSVQNVVAEKYVMTSTRADKVRVSSIGAAPGASPLTPRAELLRDLKTLRERAIAKGMKLKSMDEIRADIEELRGT